MNILNNIKTASLIVLMALTASCSDDFLSPEPSTSIPTEEIFESIITAEAALVGAYDQLSSYNFEGLYVPIMSDIMGEDVMLNSEDNWNWFVVAYQLDLLASYSYVEYPWWSGYGILYDANQIIENAQSIPDATEEEKDNLEGQAKAIRAYVMLKLVQLYAPAYSVDNTAPAILNANRVMEYNEDPLPRASLEEIYTQIESDCLSAIGLLESNTSVDPGFFTESAAQAILARAYLDMEEWEKARDMAIEAYEDYTLTTYYSGYMYANFVYADSETIFGLAYTSDDNNIYLSLPSFYFYEGGYSSIRLNDEFVNLFSEDDLRKEMMFQDDTYGDRYVTYKYISDGSIGVAERLCIRAAEMYLIEAECEAQLGNTSEAREALLAVQKRSISSAITSTNSGQDLIDEILLERRKELFGEGFRLNDIKRTNADYLRKGDHWVDFDFSANSEDYYRLTLPIPQSEIDTNTSINEEDQNPGY